MSAASRFAGILGLVVVVTACDASKPDANANKAEPTDNAATAAKPDADPKAEPAATPKSAAPNDGRPAVDMEDPDRKVEPPDNPVPPLDPKPAKSTTLVTVEASSAAAKADKLVQNVGLETFGQRLAPILATGCEAPCWQPAPMWPSSADETFVDFKLYRGKGQTTKGATMLGTFRVSEIPKPKAGPHSEIVVGLGVVDGAVVAHAKLRATGASLPLARVP